MPGIGIDTDVYSRATLGEHGESRTDDGSSECGRGAQQVFVIVAEMNRNKRIGDVIGALASMRHSRGAAGGHRPGPGPGSTRGYGGAPVRRPRIEVLFTGFVDDVRPFVANATALILPSQREGLARSIMEALALGILVVASTARGNSEVVRRPLRVVVRIGDVDGYAAAMDWMVENPDGRKRRWGGVAGSEWLSDTTSGS